MSSADWSLRLAGLELGCTVPFRKDDAMRIEFEQAVTIKPGRWGILTAPGGAVRIAVEIGLPRSPKLIECVILGTFSPAPTVCLCCGRVLKENEVVRRVPGMKKEPARELCAACWEVEAARQLRTRVQALSEDDSDEDVLLDNQDSDPDD